MCMLQAVLLLLLLLLLLPTCDGALWQPHVLFSPVQSTRVQSMKFMSDSRIRMEKRHA